MRRGMAGVWGFFLKAEPRVEDLHTNDFLPTVFPKRR